MAVSECWLDVPGYEGRYEVSDLGNIRSLPRDEIAQNGHRRAVAGGYLRPALNADGYPHVSLRVDGKLRLVTLHRLVALAFHGDRRSALHNEVAHLDGDRQNARADNLKWVSKVENRSHRKLHGTECLGEAHGAAKLTSDAVREIRGIPKGEADLAALAAKFGVTRRTVSSLRSGKGWPHISSGDGAGTAIAQPSDATLTKGEGDKP